MRRAGSLPVYSPNDPRILLTDFKDCNSKNNSESIEKIKREYHIKDEDIDSKDFKIKAERGHHDKISLGLFPSDVQVKSEESSLLLKSKSMTGSSSVSVSVSSIKSGSSIKNEMEFINNNSSNSNISSNDSDSKSITIKNEKKSIKSEVAIITPSSKETEKLSVAPRRNERRSRSTAQMDTETDVDADVVGDNKDEDIVLLKRRGNIIR